MRAVCVVAAGMMACGRIAFDPGELPASARVDAVAAGDRFSCAVRPDATVWCWGDNAFGQIGDASGEPRATPVQVAGLADVVAITARRLPERAAGPRARGRSSGSRASWFAFPPQGVSVTTPPETSIS